MGDQHKSLAISQVWLPHTIHMLPPGPRCILSRFDCLPLIVLKPVYLLIVIAANANTYALTCCYALLQIKFKICHLHARVALEFKMSNREQGSRDRNIHRLQNEHDNPPGSSSQSSRDNDRERKCSAFRYSLYKFEPSSSSSSKATCYPTYTSIARVSRQDYFINKCNSS